MNVTFSSPLNTGVNVKSPLSCSTSMPLVGPLTSVTLIVPGVGGEAPLHPMSLVVTELTKIWFTWMVKEISVALGHGPGVGVGVDAVVDKVELASIVVLAVVELVVVDVVVVPHDGGAPGQSQPQQSSELHVTTAGLVTPNIPRAVGRAP